MYTFTTKEGAFVVLGPRGAPGVETRSLDDTNPHTHNNVPLLLHIQILFYVQVHKYVTMAPTATKKRSSHTMAVKHAAISEVDKGAKKANVAL